MTPTTQGLGMRPAAKARLWDFLSTRLEGQQVWPWMGQSADKRTEWFAVNGARWIYSGGSRDKAVNGPREL